jgi:hypothetical protein
MSEDSFFYSQFKLYSRVHILFEATMLFLVYNANDKYPNGTLIDTQSTAFGLIAHGFGVAYGAASFMAISDEFGAPSMDDDYYGDADMDMDDGTDEPVDETNDNYYGYY